MDRDTYLRALALTEDEQRRVDAFIQLSRIERGLRAFIETELSAAEGLRWVRSLPQDVKEKVEGGGLDATDFPDLRKVLGSAWTKFGDSVGRLDREQVLVHLGGLEPIRNAIAHSRSVTAGELAMVQATYHVLTPLLAPHTALGALPRTDHPRILLDRMRVAIGHSSKVDSTDLNGLAELPEAEDACRAIEGYERVRARPGRSRTLLGNAREVALGNVDALLEAMPDG